MDIIELPIIDLSEDKGRLTAEELLEAAATHGFIYIRNAGSDFMPSTLDSVFELVCRVTSDDPLKQKG